MFEDVPTLQRCCCTSLRIGVIIVGFFITILCIASLVVITTKEPEINDETVELIKYIYSIATCVLGMIVGIACIIGAVLVRG